jgi:hypothetical protein
LKGQESLTKSASPLIEAVDMESKTQPLFDRLRAVPAEARKLFCVVVRQAYHGPMRPKSPGVATPVEILEACGLDVGEFYSLLASLRDGRLIEVSGDYPFEEIRLTSEASVAEAVAQRCAQTGVPLEEVFVSLGTSSFSQ